MSSYPFLSVDYLIEISDIRILNINDTLNITREMPIIFVNTDILYNFILQLLEIKVPYILITGCNDDWCVPYNTYPPSQTTVQLYNILLNNEKLVRWYSKNICISHPKLVAVPIGPKMQWYTTNFFGEDKTDTLKLYNKHYLEPSKKFKDTLSKPNLLYVNMDINTTNNPFYIKHINIRKDLIQHVSKEFNISSNTSIEKYIEELSRCKFCVSPPGRGIDAHRTWESLMVGTIPICISSDLDSIYEKLPVLIVNDYTVITKDFLEAEYLKITSKNYDFSILYCNYWKTQIYSERDSFSLAP